MGLMSEDVKEVARLQQRMRRLGAKAPDFVRQGFGDGPWSCVLTVLELNDLLNRAGVPAEPAE